MLGMHLHMLACHMHPLGCHKLLHAHGACITNCHMHRLGCHNMHMQSHEHASPFIQHAEPNGYLPCLHVRSKTAAAVTAVTVEAAVVCQQQCPCILQVQPCSQPENNHSNPVVRIINSHVPCMLVHVVPSFMLVSVGSSMHCTLPGSSMSALPYLKNSLHIRSTAHGTLLPE